MTQANIVHIIKDFITASGYAYDDIALRHEPLIDSLIFNIQTPDARRLIGRGGEVIRALNHLIHTMVDARLKPDEEFIKFTLDIDNYVADRIEHLKTQSRMMADRARSFKTDVEMDPMSSFDRMIVHNILSTASDIATKSVGMGDERRIVIKYKESGDEGNETESVKI
jgi:spoIIIJ-associated protein